MEHVAHAQKGLMFAFPYTSAGTHRKTDDECIKWTEKWIAPTLKVCVDFMALFFFEIALAIRSLVYSRMRNRCIWSEDASTTHQESMLSRDFANFNVATIKARTPP